MHNLSFFMATLQIYNNFSYTLIQYLITECMNFKLKGVLESLFPETEP